MVIDVDVRTFYINYIASAKKDAEEYRRLREEAKKIKEEFYKSADEYKNIILEAYNIDVTKYDLEWNQKKYNDGEGLYNKCIRYLSNISNDDYNKRYILQVIKYCNALRNEHKFTRLTQISYKRSNFSYKEYRDIVRTFFVKVHKCLLEGNGYEFGYGIGTILINRWNMYKTPRKMLDYIATNKRKKELLEKGVKLYDKLEAAWYKQHGIPYDGVDYRVYTSSTHYYEIKLFYSTIFKGSVIYEHSEYISKNLRGNTFKEMGDKYCKCINDIYNLGVDLKVKLNILLYLYPNKYLNFIRNAEQDKYQFRPRDCKNR